MTDPIFRQLAQHLDAIPNGYPATNSGIELRLLEKLFSPDEARLACAMRLDAEPPAEIAARLGLDPAETRKALKAMAMKGLIGFERKGGQLAFSLMPFIVGFYEAQLPRLDAELATMFEQYYQESHGAMMRAQPSVHRVIPVGEAVPVEIEVFPYERASELINGARAWGVRNCICRTQQHLIGKGCDRPLEACMVFSSIEGAFDRSPMDRAISREEAHAILRQTEDAGLIHSTGNYRDGIEYICNCCTCCCGIMRGVAEFGIPTAVARSDFLTFVDDTRCTGCGECVERCPFHALSVPELLGVVDEARCMGCGLCASACSTEALHLERRAVGERVSPPADLGEWRVLRDAQRSAGPAI